MSGIDRSTIDAWRAEFDRSPELRREFMSVEDYLAFKKAESFGRFRLCRTDDVANRDCEDEELRRQSERAVASGPVSLVERKIDTAMRRQVLRLTRIIEDHLPRPVPAAGASPRAVQKRGGAGMSVATPRVESVDPRDWAAAVAIRGALSHTLDLRYNWRPDEEANKLNRIRAAMDTLKSNYGALSPLVKEHLANSSKEFSLAVAVLIEYETDIQVALNSTSQFSRIGEGRAKTNLRAVSVVLACDALWRARTGREPAAEIRNNALPPYGRFIEAVFQEMNVGAEVRSAIRAARKYTANRKSRNI